MLESLKELSSRATPGEVTVHEGQPCNHGDGGGGGFTLCFGGMRRTGSGPVVHRLGYADDIWSDIFPKAFAEAEANIGLLAGLWNAYRSGQLHDATALAEAEARGRRQGLEWQPIETAPKNTDDVLLWVSGIHMVGYWLDRGDSGPGWYVSDGHASHALATGQPTHWMPLPSLPIATTPSETGESA